MGEWKANARRRLWCSPGCRECQVFSLSSHGEEALPALLLISYGFGFVLCACNFAAQALSFCFIIHNVLFARLEITVIFVHFIAQYADFLLFCIVFYKPERCGFMSLNKIF